MVAISRQHLSGADKAVQMRRSVCVGKGAQPELRHKKTKSPYQSGYQIFLLHGPPGLKLSAKIQCCLHSVYTRPGLDDLKL